MNANETTALELLEVLPATAVRVAAAALLSAKCFDEYFTPETANVEYLRVMLEDAITEHDITAAQLNEAASRRPRIFKPSHAAICPLDFPTAIDAYNYVLAHQYDANPLAVAIESNNHNAPLLRSLVLNGVKVFGVWCDAMDDTATSLLYTTEAGAREAMVGIEADDREAGVYEPDYYKVIDLSKYFA